MKMGDNSLLRLLIAVFGGLAQCYGDSFLQVMSQKRVENSYSYREVI